jgi:acyl-CoA synthetase (AMP-forming)/AMP-acid ligase II
VDTPFILGTLAKRKVLMPGRPVRVARQFAALTKWGFGLAGEMRSAAARNPNRLAVVDEHRGLTYSQLDQRVRRLANALRTAYGVRPGDHIGLLCNNSVGMIESLLAIVTLGARVVLINTGLGPAQLEAVITEQSVGLLMHDDDLYELLSAAPAQLPRISVDGDMRHSKATVAGLIATAPDDDLKPPDDPGTIIVLTSGTTGAPKGARRRNPPGLGPLAVVISKIPLFAGERMFVAAPVFHTWGLAAFQLCLALRGTFHVNRRFDPVTALTSINQHQCTSLFAVPVMLQRLLENGGEAPTLRAVASSGSALPGPMALRFMQVYGQKLYNLYGSTEASWASIATPEDLLAAPGTAGRPPHGTRVEILDDHGQPVAPGHIGRVYVGNDMLFEGYTGGVTHELSDGLVSTGDLGHIAEDGLLFIDGRADDMVISGGENVYPIAVEDVVAGLPQVREVAVAGVPDVEYGQRLAAWIVLHQGGRLDAEAVREYVRHRLARFSVPRDVYFVSALPRNATGKVVRRDLPLPHEFTGVDINNPRA